jgi:hypothetical protein
MLNAVTTVKKCHCNLKVVQPPLILCVNLTLIKCKYKFIVRSRDSSVGMALGYELDDRVSRVDSQQGLGFLLFATASRTNLGPTQPPIQWVPGALSLGDKAARA